MGNTIKGLSGYNRAIIIKYSEKTPWEFNGYSRYLLKLLHPALYIDIVCCFFATLRTFSRIVQCSGMARSFVRYLWVARLQTNRFLWNNDLWWRMFSTCPTKIQYADDTLVRNLYRLSGGHILPAYTGWHLKLQFHTEFRSFYARDFTSSSSFSSSLFILFLFIIIVVNVIDVVVVIVVVVNYIKQMYSLHPWNTPVVRFDLNLFYNGLNCNPQMPKVFRQGGGYHSLDFCLSVRIFWKYFSWVCFLGKGIQRW